MSLSQLLNDTSALLNDMNYSFISQNQLTRWINTSRRNAAKRTGCVRRLITGQSAFGASAVAYSAIPSAAQPGALPNPFPGSNTKNGQPGNNGDFNTDYNNDYNVLQYNANYPINYTPNGPFPSAYGAVTNSCMTIPGVERYPYIGFFNNFLKAQYAGVDKVLDTIACAVNWGGTTRPNLDWMPWDEFQAYCRAYAVLNMSYPAVWSVFNDGPQGEIWMFPVPSQYNEIELDVTCQPLDLVDDATFDAIPDGFQEALKYGAAAVAFESSGRFMQAQAMEDRFADSLGIARVAVDRGKSRTYYPSYP
jgi:hypothetical protein